MNNIFPTSFHGQYTGFSPRSNLCVCADFKDGTFWCHVANLETGEKYELSRTLPPHLAFGSGWIDPEFSLDFEGTTGLLVFRNAVNHRYLFHSVPLNEEQDPYTFILHPALGQEKHFFLSAEVKGVLPEDVRSFLADYPAESCLAKVESVEPFTKILPLSKSTFLLMDLDRIVKVEVLPDGVVATVVFLCSYQLGKQEIVDVSSDGSLVVCRLYTESEELAAYLVVDLVTSRVVHSFVGSRFTPCFSRVGPTKLLYSVGKNLCVFTFSTSKVEEVLRDFNVERNFKVAPDLSKLAHVAYGSVKSLVSFHLLDGSNTPPECVHISNPFAVVFTESL